MVDLSWAKGMDTIAILAVVLVLVVLFLLQMSKNKSPVVANGNGVKSLAESLALVTNKRFDSLECDVKDLRKNCVETHMGIAASLAGINTNIATIKDDIAYLRGKK
jgi:hypothetical protein